MSENKDRGEKKLDVELNNYVREKTHFSVESGNTKPYDIEKMTGKPLNQNNNRQGE